MPGMMDSIATLNSFLRTLLVLALLGTVGAGAWYGYRMYSSEERAALAREQELTAAHEQLVSTQKQLQQREVELARRGAVIQEQLAAISGLKEDVAEKIREIEKLQAANRLLKMQHRVAQLRVLEQGIDPETDEEYSEVEFVELSPEGEPLGEPRRFRLKGDMVYVDNWVVKFDDKYVEQSDLDRSTSIVLFRRIFGEHQKPVEGHELDQIGTQPTSYARGGKISDFEKKIWADFWNIANDQQKAAELGIRAAHGEAVSVRVREGKKYKLELRASDGLSIVPDGDIQPDEKPVSDDAKKRSA